MISSKLLAAFACAAAMAAPSLAAPAPVAGPSAKDYNLFVSGNMTARYNDTEGAVAIGGNADLKGYSVGANARGGRSDLVVGGNATNEGGSTKGAIAIGGDASFKWYGVQNGLQVGEDLTYNGGSISGPLSVGGTATFPGWWQPPAVTTAPAVLPLNIVAESLRLKSLATTLSQRTANGSVAVANGGGMLTLTGADAALNIFNLTASQAASFNTFKLNITPGSIALVNITGTAASMFNAGFQYTGASANHVLFNFHNATTLSFGGIGVMGSVLAPNAAYTAQGGVVNGQMFVSSWAQGNSGTQVNSNWFAGNLLDRPVPQPPAAVAAAPVPEPASWAMMILGFGLVGTMARRRRGRLAAA